MIKNEKLIIGNMIPSKAKNFIFVLVILVIVFSYSCRKDVRRENAAKTIKEWTGKEIKFPKELAITSIGRDTTCIDLYNDNFKILLYVDSSGCTSCRLKLYEWKMIIDESDSIFLKKPEFVFIFQPKKRDERELQIILIQNGFDHPFFIDKDNEIGRLNAFPSNSDYNCFLLDKDNKVIVIGNPVQNSGIWQLFKKVIREREILY